MSAIYLQIFFFCLVFVGVFTPFWARLLVAWKVLDIPDDRKTHAVRTPRGLGPILIVPTAVVLIFYSYPGVIFLLSISVLVLIGFLDDVRSQSALLRLSVQIVVVGFLLIDGHKVSGMAEVALLMFTMLFVINASNFMDGLNGLIGTSGASVGVLFFVLGLISENAVIQGISALLMGVSLGFLPWNFPKARIFLGDSGSYYFGSVYAVLLGAAYSSGHLFVSLTFLMVYLLDSVQAIFTRLRRRESLFTGHRLHIYQRLKDAGRSDVFIVTLVGGTTLFSGSLGIATLYPVELPWEFSLTGLMAAAIFYLSTPHMFGGKRRK